MRNYPRQPLFTLQIFRGGCTSQPVRARTPRCPRSRGVGVVVGGGRRGSGRGVWGLGERCNALQWGMVGLGWASPGRGEGAGSGAGNGAWVLGAWVWGLGAGAWILGPGTAGSGVACVLCPCARPGIRALSRLSRAQSPLPQSQQRLPPPPADHSTPHTPGAKHCD